MRALIFIIATLLIVNTAAISIKWTGYAGNNQWASNNNWYPNQVPGPSDDVTIDDGVVLVTVPAAVNSLTMGDVVGKYANLTLFQGFAVGSGGLNCEQNGNLIINSGSSQVSSTGTMTVSGNLYFTAGQISGQWNIPTSGNAYLNGGGEKCLSGATISAQGPMTLSGVVVLNQSSVITVSGTATASGAFSIQSQDSTTVMFDASAGTFTYSGGGDFQIQAPVKFGTFNYLAGNITIYDAITFANPFAIPNGSFVGTVGTAAVNMTAGVSGAGTLTASGSSLSLAAVNITGELILGSGNVAFGASATGAFVQTLSSTGSATTFTGAVSCGTVHLITGQFSGAGGLTCANGVVNSQGFNLATRISFTGSMSSTGTSLIAFNTGGSFTLTSTGSMTVTGTLSFTGAGTPGAFTNDGIVNVNGGFQVQSLNINGDGTINAAATFAVNNLSIKQGTIALSGNGKFSGQTVDITSVSKITAATAVHGVIGGYTFNCPKECDNVSTGTTTPTSTFVFTA